LIPGAERTSAPAWSRAWACQGERDSGTQKRVRREPRSPSCPGRGLLANTPHSSRWNRPDAPSPEVGISGLVAVDTNLDGQAVVAVCFPLCLRRNSATRSSTFILVPPGTAPGSDDMKPLPHPPISKAIRVGEPIPVSCSEEVQEYRSRTQIVCCLRRPHRQPVDAFTSLGSGDSTDSSHPE